MKKARHASEGPRPHARAPSAARGSAGRPGSAAAASPPLAAPESIALRAFAVLEQAVAASGPMSLDEFTHALKLPKPTVYRILNLLKGAGLLRREDAAKRYTVGPRLTAFALNLLRSNTLHAQWHRALEKAVAETGESCNLTLLEGNQVLYLDRVETSHPLRLHLEAGTRVPLHCTASGKIFLSAMGEDVARRVLGDEPYERYTAKTLTTFDALRPDLVKARRTGIGTHDCERFDDSVAIAVPVLGPDGETFAAVAVHSPASRASIRSILNCAGALREASATIAATLSPAMGNASTPGSGRGAAPASRVGRRIAA